MKSLVSVLVVLAFVLPSIRAFAYENEPDSFNNIKWGANIKDLPAMQLKQVRSDPMSLLKYRVYEMEDDEPFLGRFHIEKQYMFYDDRFFGVAINITQGKKLFDELKEAMAENHGKPTIVSKMPLERYEWSNEILITMVWSPQKNLGYLSYTYMPIRTEMMKVQKNVN